MKWLGTDLISQVIRSQLRISCSQDLALITAWLESSTLGFLRYFLFFFFSYFSMCFYYLKKGEKKGNVSIKPKLIDNRMCYRYKEVEIMVQNVYVSSVRFVHF